MALDVRGLAVGDDAAVKAGKIKADRAAKIEQKLPALAAKVVNRVPKTHS